MSGAFSTGQTQSNGSIGVSSGMLGTELESLLMCEGIQPGSSASYEICKTIYLYHPLGAKMVDTPVKLAMSQNRQISVPNAPESVVKAFLKEWEALGCDEAITNVVRLSRIYGVATIVYGIFGVPTDRPLSEAEITKGEIYFNTLDPLNTSGSLVLNQDPNAPDFQKPVAVTANGQSYHATRSFSMMNEKPVYIAYSSSAYGYVGRSVYQRALFPLKSFIQTMLTDDMISQKAGVLIAKIKQPGSILDRIMAGFAGLKRTLLQGARNYNVLSISTEEEIESLNLQNIDGASSMARDNIIKNTATAADMPAKLLSNEAFVEGFGEGQEDARNIAHWIDGFRKDMEPAYKFLENIAMRRAWNEDFYETVKEEYKAEYGRKNYKTAFFEWQSGFSAVWPSLLTEPDSEKIKVDETRLKATVQILEVLLPNLDPENKVRLIQWAADNLNENEMLFVADLVINDATLEDFFTKQQEMGEQQNMMGGMPGDDEANMPVPTGIKTPPKPKPKPKEAKGKVEQKSLN